MKNIKICLCSEVSGSFTFIKKKFENFDPTNDNTEPNFTFSSIKVNLFG